MNIVRALLASLLSLVCTLAVSAFVTIQTVQTTVLDRTVVKTWFFDSGVYNSLFPTLVNANLTTQQDSGGNSPANMKIITEALDQTFSPSYVQQQTEGIIDSTYDWLDGNATDIVFSINLTSKADEFTGNYRVLLEEKLADLPSCDNSVSLSAEDPTCVPAKKTPAQAAKDIADDVSNDTAFFEKPITNETLFPESAQSNPDVTNQLPMIVAALRMLAGWLLGIAVVAGGLSILLSRRRLKESQRLAGRLTVGLFVTSAVGLVLAQLGGSFSFENYVNNALAANIVEPLLRQALPAIGARLALISGIAGVVTLIAWFTLRFFRRRRDQQRIIKEAKEDAAQHEAKPQKNQNLPTPETTPTQQEPKK